MPIKTVATVASALALVLLAGAPLRAQSMFEQMPTIPEDNAPAQAAQPAQSGRPRRLSPRPCRP